MSRSADLCTELPEIVPPTQTEFGLARNGV